MNIGLVDIPGERLTNFNRWAFDSQSCSSDLYTADGNYMKDMEVIDPRNGCPQTKSRRGKLQP